MTTNGNNNAAMGNYMDNSPNVVNMANMSRQSMSPSPSQMNGGSGGGGGGGGGGNGMGNNNNNNMMMNGLPMNAGHQMDLNNLYDMVVEFSDILKNNREMTRGIVSSAEEIMVCYMLGFKRLVADMDAASIYGRGHESRHSSSQWGNIWSVYPQIPIIFSRTQRANMVIAARIAELERALARERRTVEALEREQIENTSLIGEFETSMGIMVEQIRNYCQNNNMYFLAQKKEYNGVLQAERDAHLSSRLDRDHWHAQTMRLAEMLRTAYRLRCEEDQAPTRIIQALQSEVRALRSAIGLEAEKPEEETGYDFLKDLSPPVVD
jgi:hypothetical protein